VKRAYSVPMDASKLIERAEQVFRIAILVGRKEHKDQLLAICDDYIKHAEARQLSDGDQARLATLRAEIADREAETG
jgi:hypothetical protein